MTYETKDGVLEFITDDPEFDGSLLVTYKSHVTSHTYMSDYSLNSLGNIHKIFEIAPDYLFNFIDDSKLVRTVTECDNCTSVATIVSIMGSPQSIEFELEKIIDEKPVVLTLQRKNETLHHDVRNLNNRLTVLEHKFDMLCKVTSLIVVKDIDDGKALLGMADVIDVNQIVMPSGMSVIEHIVLNCYCKQSTCDTLQGLIDRKGSVNVIDAAGASLIIRVLSNRSISVYIDVVNGAYVFNCTPYIKILIDAGATVTARDKYNRSALDYLNIIESDTNHDTRIHKAVQTMRVLLTNAL